MEGMTFTHNFDFESACGQFDYTNYVPGFRSCLDWIYLEKDKMSSLQVVPMPSHKKVTQYGALPNVVFPSDHMALVCDLTWKDQVKAMDCDS